MRKVLFTLLGIFILVGCNEGERIKEGISKKSFPKELAGTWEADKDKKAVEIDNKGNLVSFTYGAGLKIKVVEGGISQKSPNSDSMLYMILGKTQVEYERERRFLRIVINFDDYRIELPDGSVSGTMKEVIEGEISKDNKIWQATSTIEGTIENLPQANDTTVAHYFFRKIE